MRQGWRYVAISDAFDTITGSTPPKSDPALYGGYIPLVKPPELQDAEVTSAEDGLSVSGAAVSRIAPVDSILVSCIGNLGKVGLACVPLAFNQQINAILPNPQSAIPRFMFYQVQSSDFRDQLESKAGGTTIPIVNKSKFNGIFVALPPLAEQQHIVATLDEAFAAIATAKANTEKNLTNVRAVFESKLASVFDHVATHSELIRLGDAVDRLTNGFVGPTRGIYQESGIPYLLARHVKSNVLTFDGRTFISPAFNAKAKKSMLKAGDVLVVQSGHIGHSAVVPAEHEGHNCHAMIVITPKEDLLDGAYLSAIFGSPQMQGHFRAIRTGSTVPHLNCGDVIEMKIPRPSVSQQKLIAGALASFRSECDQLAEIALRKLSSLDSLKASLLHHAFTGQLSDSRQHRTSATA